MTFTRLFHTASQAFFTCLLGNIDWLYELPLSRLIDSNKSLLDYESWSFFIIRYIDPV